MYLQHGSGPTGSLLILAFHKQLHNPTSSKQRLCQKKSTAGGCSECFIRGVSGWKKAHLDCSLAHLDFGTIVGNTFLTKKIHNYQMFRLC